MISFTLSKIASVLNAEWIGQDQEIQSVSIESKKIGKQCLFIALQGRRFNGHDFVDQAVFMGACALLVSRYFTLNIPQLIVRDTCFALSQLATWIRQQVSPKVIAITGSSGKTSVKEMTASILRGMGRVVATQGNCNNKIGVALTLLRLTYGDIFAVIELGANDFGEIAWMTTFVNPDIVLINNIFSAHLLGFGSLFGVAEAKGEILSNLSHTGICVLNVDNNAYWMWKNFLSCKLIVSFSLQKRTMADFFVTNIFHRRGDVQFILHTPYGYSPITLSMFGNHNISNALAASALSYSAGATLKAIVLGLEKMCAIRGRLFPIFLRSNKLLLDDSYNSNIGSILASVYVLRRVRGYRVIVLGDVRELGNMGIAYHRKIGELLSTSNIHKVLTIGHLSCFISHFSGRGEHFCSRTALFFRLIQLLDKNEVITVLIKGSRNTFMDQLVMELREHFI